MKSSPTRLLSLCLACFFGLAWAFGQAAPVPAEQDKDKKAQEKPAPPSDKKEEPKQPARKLLPKIEDLVPPGALDPAQMKQLQRQLEMAQQQIDRALERQQRALKNPVLPVAPLRPGFRGAEVNRLGAGLSQPEDTLVDQLGLARGEGLVLTDVKPDSAADKAGLKKNDILLEIGGKKVAGQPGEFLKVLNEFKTGDKLEALVLRRGKKETVKDVTLPDVPESRPGRGLPIIPRPRLPRPAAPK
jgi:C-terminal processing protease CtpA/Prc